MDLGLQGKVMLVSAASKGLGFGIAQALAREGARVALCSRDQASAEAAAETIRAESGAEVMAAACDVSDPASVMAWVDGVGARWGTVHGLLINAGGPPAGFFKELTDEQWLTAFNITLMSAVRLTRAALPYLREGGAILTITSSSVREPVERLALSTVMRSGVVGLVKTLSDELAGDGVRVNNLMPGRIDTERVAQLDAGASKRLGIPVEQVREQSISKIPLGRLGTIAEFGAAGAFLLSPAASYITGASLRVDGGMMRSI